MSPRKPPIDLTQLRYVLYARKSTDEDSKQTLSLPDQVRDCKALAENLGLNVVAVIEEPKPAKNKGKRPKFNELLKNIGIKYDAILSWHPDRLSRNMYEGGQIIDMLDEGVLKDLRFHSHEFTNDANGKMMLGMLFVFSKQYSDALSFRISESVDKRFDEGKSAGQPKWGYDRDIETGLYEPNEFFEIVQQAWIKRSNGEPYKDIVMYLNSKGYHRRTKQVRGKDVRKKKAIKPSENSLSTMFRDPFYFGVLEQTNQTVDLRQIYDSEPMITEEIFNKVQSIAYKRTRDTSSKKRVEFKPLRRMVYCAVCYGTHFSKSGEPLWMSVGKNLRGDGKHHVLSYECKNKECSRKPKSVRAIHIFNAIYNKLDSLRVADEAYELYSKQIEVLTDEKIVKIREEVRSRKGAMSHMTSEIEDRSLNLAKLEPGSTAFTVNEAKIEELAAERQQLEEKIEELEKKVANPSRIKLTKDQFLNLLKTAPDKMRAANAVEKDRLARIFFSNLLIDDEMNVDFIWRPPFDSLMKSIELSSGAQERT